VSKPETEVAVLAKPGLFFHDAWNEYAVFTRKRQKILNGGLHYYMVIKSTMASTLNF
jgi:hypothetical protein